jgi:hypothetical protein
MKLCYCNNCEFVFEDMNPADNSPDFSDDLPFGPLEIIKDEEDGPEEFFWACPNCKTDEYLSDILPDEEVACISRNTFWEIENGDTKLISRQRGSYSFEFQMEGSPRVEINLESYTIAQLDEICHAGYSGIYGVIEDYGRRTFKIIAEMIYELKFANLKQIE